MLLFFVMENGGVSYPDIKQENDEVDIKILCKLSDNGGSMTGEDIQNRKRYIEEVRNSFPECGIETPEPPKAVASPGIRLRLFLAVSLFAVFFTAQKSDLHIFGLSTDEIIEKIEENYDYTNLEKYVMMIFDSINL